MEKEEIDHDDPIIQQELEGKSKSINILIILHSPSTRE